MIKRIFKINIEIFFVDNDIIYTYLAISAAVWPFKSTILGFAPLAIKSSTWRTCPARAATCKGVVPFSYTYTNMYNLIKVSPHDTTIICNTSVCIILECI